MAKLKDLAMISYARQIGGDRFRQSAYDPVPPWAVDVRSEVPTDEEMIVLIVLREQTNTN